MKVFFKSCAPSIYGITEQTQHFAQEIATKLGLRIFWVTSWCGYTNQGAVKIDPVINEAVFELPETYKEKVKSSADYFSKKNITVEIHAESETSELSAFSEWVQLFRKEDWA